MVESRAANYPRLSRNHSGASCVLDSYEIAPEFSASVPFTTFHPSFYIELNQQFPHVLVHVISAFSF